MTGFNSKSDAAADKLQEPYDQTALELCNVCGWKTLIPTEGCLNCERKVPLPVQPVHSVQSNGKHSPLLTHMMNKRTAPPQRPWVGLTVQERNDCLVQADPCECLADTEAHQLMVEVEAKLRDRNS